jgi:MFS transporter, ACS family, glucarate transporter
MAVRPVSFKGNPLPQRTTPPRARATPRRLLVRQASVLRFATGTRPLLWHDAPVTTASRRTIVLLLSAFSLVGYLLRMNISVASPAMMAELHLDKIQMGQVFSAFMLGYALFQVPWGVSGDRLGPGRTLTWAALVWTATTALTGLLPGWLVAVGTSSLLVLLVLRFLLGVGQAAAYPLAARAIVNWLPATRRATSFSALIVGLSIGCAFTPPLVSWVTTRFGWRASFYVCALLACGLAVAWRQTAGARLDRIGDEGIAAPAVAKAWYAPLGDRHVAILCVSYFFDAYLLFVFVFWLYLYLVEQRGMSLLSSGLSTALPFVLAIFFTPAAGHLCDQLAVRFGSTWGRRTVATIALLSSAVFLAVGVDIASPTLAVAGLSLAVAFLLCTEGAYWGASMDLGGAGTGTVGGIMNMAGNLGGVVSTALMPVLIKHYGWPFAFRTAAGLAVVAAALWIFIRLPAASGVGALREERSRVPRL